MYKVVYGSRLPCMIVCCICLSTIFTFVALNTAVKLLSQSVLIEINGLFRSGETCACLARSGRNVCGRNSMWGDVMILPFVILIGISVVVIVL